MIPERTNYDSLESEYLDSNRLMYKKIRLVDAYIPNGGTFLDIGMGTGNLISLRIGKHPKIYGIDNDEKSLQICRQKFFKNSNVKILPLSIDQIHENFTEKIYTYLGNAALSLHKNKGYGFQG